VVGARNVTMLSQERNQELSEARWIGLSANGFSSKKGAQEFGEQLRSITEMAGLCCRLGVDVGLGKLPAVVNEEFARASSFIQPHERLFSNVHGLSVVPDDENSHLPIVKMQATLRADPDQFVNSLAHLGGQIPVNLSMAAPGVWLLNLALINPKPLAQLAPALSAIEAMGQDEEWSTSQSKLIEVLTKQAETRSKNPENLEVAEALRRGLHRIGLRQGVNRVLGRLGLTHLTKEWDRIYGQRSGLFHGTIGLTESEIAELANDAVVLRGRIILALVERSSIELTEMTTVHFPIE
jgi:hypothetical protein